MKNIMRLLKQAMLACVLILPAVSWADDHFLDIVGPTISQRAIVPDTGVLTQTLILAAGFNAEPNPLEFGAGQSLTVVKALVKLCAPGTGGLLEWQDQGLTVVGVTGALTSTTPNTYSMTFGMTGISDTYASPGACTVQGAKTYNYTSTALIRKGRTTVLATSYNFWNVANLVPVPGTILLLLIGMTGLGWLSMKRQKQAQAQGAKNKD